MSMCWRWRRRRRAQLEVAHPCVGVVDGDQLTTGMQRLRSGLLRGHGAMARRIHNARVNESVGLDLYSFNTLIRGCGQVIWSVHGRCSMVRSLGSYEEKCGLCYSLFRFLHLLVFYIQSSGKYEMNLPNMQKPGCGKGSAVDRSREQTIGAVKKKMKEQMDDFQVMRESIGQEYREVVERRVFTVTGNRLDEETIDGLIETGRSEQIFKDAVQQQGRAQFHVFIVYEGYHCTFPSGEELKYGGGAS
ncbi:uncharacterized protein LOC125509567 isoform X2 [Triticum urartu]|uniref:uncharacterized protein LOC125509567 isoform X2 n=1 Tax=Triticum urartu TaxID=4572 RepID=UPI002042DC0F|nr:uncharacterized protein LOC125509567 isoform X2 [Triticum urartu]